MNGSWNDEALLGVLDSLLYIYVFIIHQIPCLAWKFGINIRGDIIKEHFQPTILLLILTTNFQNSQFYFNLNIKLNYHLALDILFTILIPLHYQVEILLSKVNLLIAEEKFIIYLFIFLKLSLQRELISRNTYNSDITDILRFLLKEEQLSIHRESVVKVKFANLSKLPMKFIWLVRVIRFALAVNFTSLLRNKYRKIARYALKKFMPLQLHRECNPL